MENESGLGAKLREAREKRGWTLHMACEGTRGRVGWESLARLESGRTQDPRKITIRTAMALIELYWPDIQLEDFSTEFGHYAIRTVRVRRAENARD